MNTHAPLEGMLKRTLHHEFVVEALRELILAGELEPRSRVNEAALCVRFGISRTPLREAIKLLAAEGLLELLPNRGARVAAISDVEIDEIVEVVAALEGAAGDDVGPLRRADQRAGSDCRFRSRQPRCLSRRSGALSIR